jgi:non-heme chloroperoxidase
MPITDREKSEVDAANLSGKQPIAFVHGLWLLPNSWDAWRSHFEELGYSTIAPGWPDDPDTIEEALAKPEVFAGKGINDICVHLAEVMKGLSRKPIIIGHSFGGMLTQKLAGLGYGSASVSISPAPFRGILPLPFSALKVASVALKNPANKDRAIRLTEDEFRYGFANLLSDEECKTLYNKYSVPGPGKVLFQAAFANFNPGTEAKVVHDHPDRGPMLIISGDSDHTVPWAIANASYKKQRKNSAPTEIAKIPHRGHSLTIDSGWREVADSAEDFLEQQGIKP